MNKEVFDTQILYTSSNYCAFRRAPGNRGLSEAGIRDKVASLSAHGFIREHPIAVVTLQEYPGIYYVVDGQHRLMACERLKIPFIFRIIPDSRSLFEVMKSLNVHQRPWRAEDYLEAYAEVGEGEYIRTRDFLRLHRFGIRALIGANFRLKFFDQIDADLKGAFQAGEVRINSVGFINTTKVFGEINTVSESSESFKKIKDQKRLLVAYSWLRTSSKFELGRLIDGCLRRPSIIGYPIDNRKFDVKHLMEIYNFRISTKHKIYFAQNREGLWIEEV